MAKAWKPIVVILIAAAVVGVVAVKSHRNDSDRHPASSAVKTGPSAVEALASKRETPMKASPKQETSETERKPASKPEPAPVKPTEPADVQAGKAPAQAEKKIVSQKTPAEPAVETVPKPTPEKPKKLPKLVDFGADWCVPCKAMTPILEELAAQYAGQLEVVFVNTQDHPDLGQLYGIEQIPTQVFYNADGVEFSRHVGYYPKKEILKTFRLQGIDLKPR